tara:strand:+ start:593 stop:2128 length:1536 start_codon:yes stop_codon:yes gene_type:complete
MEMFGYEFNKKADAAPDAKIKSFVPQDEMDDAGSTVVGAGGGHYGYSLDIDGAAHANESELIYKYRQASTQPECDTAIEDIVNESIIVNVDGKSVTPRLDNVKASPAVKAKISEEFATILDLMQFTTKGHDIFKQWYVDGRYPYHVILDPANPKKGIAQLRYIDPTKLTKVKEVETKKDPATGLEVNGATKTYFVYQKEFGGEQGVKISPDSIAYATSGQLDVTRSFVVSYMHKALRPTNMLRMMEDAVVIYRIARAPERRVFYIDVGNLPKSKAENYISDIMNKYRNKMVYDSSTGEVKDTAKNTSMMEDFFLPRREGGRGTEVDTLSGGANLGEIDDILYFQHKLYKSLSVPISRLETSADSSKPYTVGRSGDIDRDEIKFKKFIDKLRNSFSKLFLHLLRIQLISKGIITEQDWNSFRNQITFDYMEDNYYSELKDNEIWQGRIEMLQSIDEYIGKYVSDAWVKRNILRMTEEEVVKMDAEIKAETKAGDHDDDVWNGDDPRFDNNPT